MFVSGLGRQLIHGCGNGLDVVAIQFLARGARLVEVSPNGCRPRERVFRWIPGQDTVFELFDDEVGGVLGDPEGRGDRLLAGFDTLEDLGDLCNRVGLGPGWGWSVRLRIRCFGLGLHR